MIRIDTQRAVLCVTLLATGLPGQVRDRVVLRPGKTLAWEFVAVGSIRELRSGKVLVTDPRQNRMVEVDFSTGAVSGIGKVGEGPGEYRRAVPLYPLRGDSSLAPDVFGRRWLLLHGSRIVAILPPTSPLVGSTTTIMGIDSTGAVLSVRPGATPSRPRVMVRLGRGPSFDTLGALAPLPTGLGLGTLPDFPPEFERAAMGWDGWIAIIRLTPFRVDWISPSGKMIEGKVQDIERTRMDERERNAFLKPLSVNGKMPSADQVRNWPIFLPVWDPTAPLRFTPDGMLCVQRWIGSRDLAVTYDIVDRRGSRRKELSLPRNERVIGFGARSLYVAVTDEDDIERVKRYPWP